MWTERARAKRDKTHWNERLHLAPEMLPLVQSCFSTGNARCAWDALLDYGIPAIDSSRHLYRGARLWQGPARLPPGGGLDNLAPSTTITVMLQFFAFCFVLSFVLLMGGIVEAALLAFGVAVVTPFAYIAWHVLTPAGQHQKTDGQWP